LTAFTFVVPVGNEDVLRTCLLSSTLFRTPSQHELLLQRGARSAAEAFNNGIDRAANDLIVCLHQDVVLPDLWPERFASELAKLNTGTEPVGVVGCAGITGQGRAAAHIYRHDREFYPNIELPAEVETLDELLICFRKSSGLRFDEKLPSFFGYAIDLCLEAISRGMQNFVVDAPCFHQARSREGRMPKGFFSNWNYLCDKWKPFLPVHSLTGTLHHKKSFLVHSIIESVKEHIGYVPEPWWRNLPKIDTESALRGNAGQNSTSY
jgi:cellulose synthase/poly-beta-1,6-N-acetylglucosamine synthase-like glycosyltransferase